jgi:hypothetical protein
MDALPLMAAPPLMDALPLRIAAAHMLQDLGVNGGY